LSSCRKGFAFLSPLEKKGDRLAQEETKPLGSFDYRREERKEGKFSLLVGKMVAAAVLGGGERKDGCRKMPSARPLSRKRGREGGKSSRFLSPFTEERGGVPPARIV